MAESFHRNTDTWDNTRRDRHKEYEHQKDNTIYLLSDIISNKDGFSPSPHLIIILLYQFLRHISSFGALPPTLSNNNCYIRVKS
mmetsp:Transcript_29601/g.36021  ORF Transcript_29601/g.36021 Transcript_29601/m.36021 type:complete len:84 (+) Transcript_29601:161-412(+)